MRKTIVLLATSLVLLAGCSKDGTEEKPSPEGSSTTTADTPAVVELPAAEERPESLSPSDMSEQEQVWYETAQKIEGENVPQPITFLAPDSTGVQYDSEKDELSLIRAYEPSAEMKAYLDIAGEGIQAWREANGAWPVASWGEKANGWLLRPNPSDKKKAKPVKLDLPETLVPKGYTDASASGYFHLEDTGTGERSYIVFEDGKVAGTASLFAIPVK